MSKIYLSRTFANWPDFCNLLKHKIRTPANCKKLRSFNRVIIICILYQSGLAFFKLWMIRKSSHFANENKAVLSPTSNCGTKVLSKETFPRNQSELKFFQPPAFNHPHTKTVFRNKLHLLGEHTPIFSRWQNALAFCELRRYDCR